MFIFFDVEFEGSLYILDTSPLLNICSANILSHIHGSSFRFLNGVFQGEKAIDLGEVQGETFPSTSPSAPGSRRFSGLSGARRHDSQPCVGAGTVASSPLVRFLPWPCVDSYLAKYRKEASAASRPLFSSRSLCRGRQPCEPMLPRHSAPTLPPGVQPGLPFPAPGTFSRQQVEATTGLTSFASHLTESAGFHCLLSNFIRFCLTFQQF